MSIMRHAALARRGIYDKDLRGGVGSAVVMLPNRDIEVSTFTPGSQLVVNEKTTPSGPDFDACIMPSSDVRPDQDRALPRLTECAIL